MSRRKLRIAPPHPEHIGLVRRELRIAAPLLDAIQARLHDHPGRPAQLRVAAIFAAGWLNAYAHRPQELTNMLHTLRELPRDMRIELGVHHNGKDCTYRQLTHLFGRLCELLSQNADQPIADLDRFFTEALEAQCDETGLRFTGAVALDGTVQETSARTRWRQGTTGEVVDDEPATGNKAEKKSWKAFCSDPDAALGHAPAKNGMKAGFAMGYEVELFTPLLAPGQPSLNLISGSVFHANHTGERVKARDLLIDRASRYQSMICDRGYHFAGKNSFAKLNQFGVDRYFEPLASARKPGLTGKEGALIIDGDIFHPSLPERLRDLPAGLDKTTGGNRAEIDAWYQEREAYRYERNGGTETAYRGRNPAAVGKLRCPHFPSSMKLGPEIPSCGHRRGEPHLCPKKPTASAPKKLVQGTRQGHPLGTPQWLELYRKGRSQVESVNSMLRGNVVHTPQRTWCRVRGRAKTGLLFGLQCMASNTLQLWNHDVIEPEL